MRRTQIYLEDEDAELLNGAAARTGASHSELIRRAIRAQYKAGTTEGRLRALQSSAGLWGNLELTGEEYVDRLRGDLYERLDRLGLG